MQMCSCACHTVSEPPTVGPGWPITRPARAHQLPPPPPPPPPPEDPPLKPLPPFPPGVEAIAVEICDENALRSRDMFIAENVARFEPLYQPRVASLRSRPSNALAHCSTQRKTFGC